MCLSKAPPARLDDAEIPMDRGLAPYESPVAKKWASSYNMVWYWTAKREFGDATNTLLVFAGEGDTGYHPGNDGECRLTGWLCANTHGYVGSFVKVIMHVGDDPKQIIRLADDNECMLSYDLFKRFHKEYVHDAIQ